MSNPISPWIKMAAYAVPLCVLPSALWRFWHLGWGTEMPPICSWQNGFEPYYVAALSVVSFGAALLTIGLVRPWGEVFPRWIPFLGDRTVPVAAAAVPASIGCLLIFGLYAYGPLNTIFEFYQPVIPPDCPQPTEGPYGWVVAACYAPLLLWGPLLTIVTFAYYRRRTRIRI